MKSLEMFIAVMAFYAVLSCALMPVAFYYLGNRTLKSAGNGFLVGSVVTVVMWLSFRSQIV
jgi:hypothetical protein